MQIKNPPIPLEPIIFIARFLDESNRDIHGKFTSEWERAEYAAREKFGGRVITVYPEEMSWRLEWSFYKSQLRVDVG